MVLLQGHVGLRLGPVGAVGQAGHEAVAERVGEAAHHLPHALIVRLEGVAAEKKDTRRRG